MFDKKEYDREYNRKHLKETNYEAQKKWNKEHQYKVAIYLNREFDADVIERLEKTGNKTGYIRELVRRDAHLEEKTDRGEEPGEPDFRRGVRLAYVGGSPPEDGSPRLCGRDGAAE